MALEHPFGRSLEQVSQNNILLRRMAWASTVAATCLLTSSCGQDKVPVGVQKEREQDARKQVHREHLQMEGPAVILEYFAVQHLRKNLEKARPNLSEEQFKAMEKYITELEKRLEARMERHNQIMKEHGLDQYHKDLGSISDHIQPLNPDELRRLAGTAELKREK